MITKPLRISKINWGNPLTEGLAFFAPLNEMAGAPFNVLPAPNPAVTMGSASWGARGVIQPAASVAPRWSTTAGEVGLNNFTVLLITDCPAGAAFSYMCSNRLGADSNQFWGLCSNLNAGGSVASGYIAFVGINGGAIKQNANTNSAVLDGTVKVIVGVKSGGRYGTLYVDGKAFPTVDAASYTYSSGLNTLGLGMYFTGTNYSSPATHQMLAVWNRALSPAEVAAISANPWQLLAQSSASRIMRMLTAVPGGFSGVSRGRTLAGISRGRLL